MSKILVDTIDTRSGTSTLTLGSTNAGTIALGSGDVQSNFLYPAFEVYLSSEQSISNATYNKAQYDSKSWDTDNAFDNTTNYRFTVPSGKAGKYAFYSTVVFDDINNGQIGILRPYKNGSSISNSPGPAQLNQVYSSGSAHNIYVNYYGVLDLAVGDYIEMFLYQNTGAAINARSTNTQFGGFRIGT